jgi:hypothetical protein
MRKTVAKKERALSSKDYTTSFSVEQSPEEAFRAINNVRAWWEGQIEGSTDKVGGVFTYQYEDFHRSKQKVMELVPGRRVVWDVIEGGPKFVTDRTEWKGTRIVFDIVRKGSKTEVRFTHQGLIPRLECYDSCTDAWGSIIRGSLRDLITASKEDS